MSVVFYAWELAFPVIWREKVKVLLLFVMGNLFGKQAIDVLAVSFKPGFSMVVAFKHACFYTISSQG